ncbi:hypothetical protein [Aurantiacibacter spongiae]|uniref:DUF429 domain-containing protein n=1 Tax=Aurantiacibacter spongiae TaxID=2488860 RepID=A0A3N5CUS3_9SPHN|nr:hypothetical protein [Aurantiacibacter spongiae]RPF72086.1 hypothetical protein EG799_11005 [Aurantiacibacter spongiae]
MSRFSHFIAIDWSGAAGERHTGIAVACADADGGAPALLHSEGGWSRVSVLALLRDDLPDDTLVGLDLGIALPFADCGAYFPGHPDSPPDARALWAMVDRLCADDPHLGARGFVDHPDLAPYFRRHGGREGALFRCDDAAHGRGRFRVTERAQEREGCRPTSNFNLVGAAQVGKSSLTGMRMLNRLAGRLPVWPVDPLPPRGSVVVEIYTTLAAIAAGRRAGRSKIRTREGLDNALRALASPPIGGAGPIDDHATDALVSAAWLRRVADRRELWTPGSMTREIARTEGWTFGVM